MTIQKPDFNQIFASQAPDVDKPPVFNNYNGGMGDEYRPNNGKPTIKGFNYLQQLNDNKFLWIAQNGAFPYDPNIEYNVGIVTLKDGRFKQWNGTDWINFGQDDSALKFANNLSDLESKESSRNNLEVYSKIEVDDAISSAIPSDVPNATETTAGKAKIATTAIAQAGVNDTDFITALKLFEVLDFDYVDKTSTRSLNTVYTNDNKIRRLNLTSNTTSNTTVSLRVEVTKNSITTLLVVDMNANAGGLALGGSVDVPPNAQYKVNFYTPDGAVTTGYSIKTWLEC